MEPHGTFHWHIVHLPMENTGLRSGNAKTVVLRQTAIADLSQCAQLNAVRMTAKGRLRPKLLQCNKIRIHVSCLMG